MQDCLSTCNHRSKEIENSDFKFACTSQAKPQLTLRKISAFGEGNLCKVWFCWVGCQENREKPEITEPTNPIQCRPHEARVTMTYTEWMLFQDLPICLWPNDNQPEIYSMPR